MSAGTAKRPSVGVWTEWGASPGFKAEGLARLLSFLVDGAARSQCCVFRVVVAQDLKAGMCELLTERAGQQGVDWTVHAVEDFADPWPPDGAAENAASGDLFDPRQVRAAEIVGTSLQVDGWLVFMPFYTEGLHLPRPRAWLFPDTIPFDFPLGWPEEAYLPGGYWWFRKEQIKRVLEAGDNIVTFSRHVARRGVQGMFGVAPERIRVAHHGMHRLDDPHPFLAGGSGRTPETRALAAEQLRRWAVQGAPHMRDFRFEEVDYVLVSTQMRRNKNVGFVIDAVRQLIQRDRRDIKLILTARAMDELQPRIDSAGLQDDVLTMQALPGPEHAALLHCAALTVHPSVFEGGCVPFPFSEAVSVGVPCLMADGPHAREGLERYDIGEWLFDPFDLEALVALVHRSLEERDSLLARQRHVLESNDRHWTHAARDYMAAVLESVRGAERAALPS